MRHTLLFWRMVSVSLAGLYGLAIPASAQDQAKHIRELAVHVAQANNQSPYTFIRAKSEPGEVSDPWMVRFFDKDNKEIPYFVWDSVIWKTAQEGRADWGNRFALLNHAPGQWPGVAELRMAKVEWAKKQLPQLGVQLGAQEEAAKKHESSVCAALYLLRFSAPPFAKERLKLRVYSSPQVAPKQRTIEGPQVGERISVAQGDLRLEGVPDRLAVTWKGKELFRYAGFEAGETGSKQGHVDPSRPFSVRVDQGVITRIVIEGTTPGRKNGLMHWQCTYWLFPEGSYSAVEGFSLSNTEGYLGGEQKLSIWETDAGFKQVQAPNWDRPWWLHQAGDDGFVASHLFTHTPLTVGYGNNPFTVNPVADAPKMESNGNRLSLRWVHRLEEPDGFRLLSPTLAENPEWGWFAGKREMFNRDLFLTGKVTNPPPGMTPEAKRALEEAVKLVRWQPKVDWLYRQYAVGVGNKADEASKALRQVLGAAAGWIDRPFDQEELAAVIVRKLQDRPATSTDSSRDPLLIALPYLLQPDPSGPKEAVKLSRNLSEYTDYVIKSLQINVQRGGNPIDGQTQPKQPGDIVGEGWIINPAYHAAMMPTAVRFLEHFEVPHPQKEYRDAILRYADYSLEHLGGKPLNFDKLRTSFRSHFPNRFVMILPLMLHAHTLTKDPKYAKAATMMFDDLLELVERNPHGYWPAWSFRPGAMPFDITYNPAGHERGIVSFWADRLLDLIGRDKATRYAAAQARWCAFSGQLLDTLEAANGTYVRAADHPGTPWLISNQFALYLYDDFPFYRGLVGHALRWQGIWEMPYMGCHLQRWALGIGNATRWFEHQVESLPDKKGVKVRVRNGLPWTQPTLWLRGADVGGLVPAQDHLPALWLRVKEPTWAGPTDVAVMKDKDGIRVRIRKAMTVRLYHSMWQPNWAQKKQFHLTHRSPDGSVQRREVSPGSAAFFGAGSGERFIEWEALPGEYELKAIP